MDSQPLLHGKSHSYIFESAKSDYGSDLIDSRLPWTRKNELMEDEGGSFDSGTVWRALSGDYSITVAEQLPVAACRRLKWRNHRQMKDKKISAGFGWANSS